MVTGTGGNATDPEKSKIESARHRSMHDTGEINKAVERASRDAGFIENAASLLKDMKFPAFKHNIMDHIKSKNPNRQVFALFESLDGYIKYNDVYHVQKALEENNIEKKTEFQITDETRNRPDVRTRNITADTGIKEKEAVNEREERRDYPEVTPTAMSNFVCEYCGKAFQNQNDLAQHQKFESGKTVMSP